VWTADDAGGRPQTGSSRRGLGCAIRPVLSARMCWVESTAHTGSESTAYRVRVDSTYRVRVDSIQGPSRQHTGSESIAYRVRVDSTYRVRVDSIQGPSRQHTGSESIAYRVRVDSIQGPMCWVESTAHRVRCAGSSRQHIGCTPGPPVCIAGCALRACRRAFCRRRPSVVSVKGPHVGWNQSASSHIMRSARNCRTKVGAVTPCANIARCTYAS
jgi:hypothetical protein